MSQLLEGLNPAQQLAVTTTEGPVLVLAGPGSGKTRVLTHRVAYLIREKGVRPWQIMAVTFTNKAAREMKDRLSNLIGSIDLGQLTIGTFHAICVRLLHREATTLGLNPNFVIYDDSDQQALMRRAIAELNLDDKRFRPRTMHSIISRAKTEMLTPAEFEPRTYQEEVARRIYVLYEKLLTESNALDFDDLLLKVVLAFREHPDLLHKYQDRYHYVLVDEFQDTNAVQYELVRQFSGGTRNLFGVGDEDQSVYGFRGADFRNVLRFEKDYGDTKKILLEQNYRSTQTILDVANAVIAPNIQRTAKTLFTEREKGTVAFVHEAYDEDEEARWVVERIRQLGQQEIAPGDCAVMYRTNAQSRALEEAFLVAGMPYKLVGATRFYGRREIKDLMAYLRIIQNPYDSVSLGRIINVPARKIGGKTLGSLNVWAASKTISTYDAMVLMFEGESAPVSSAGRGALLRFYMMWNTWLLLRGKASALALLDQVIDQTGYEGYLRDGTDQGEERWENVLELRAVAAQYTDIEEGQSLNAFLEEVSLVSDVDNLDDSNAPTLLTLHAAKGLEFAVVFIVGLNDKLIPHSRSFDDPDAMEEERRLFYVGVTRAQDRLYMLHTFRRSVWGSSEVSEPSRYLKDIPSGLKTDPDKKPAQAGAYTSRRDGYQRGLLGHGTEQPQSGARTRAQRRSPSSTGDGPFRVGDQVRHRAFGEGTVIAVEARGSDWDVTIAFKGRGIKTLAASFANLEEI
ncbi:MAG: UvrD-helicase domain-containing protein [Anaerolineae bacterium]|nr:UvrD-helicase domain-containing protein [Anaerolineae bacterium]